MSKSTALARLPDKASEEAEKIPPMTSLMVPAALLLAAESVSAKDGEVRSFLCGVFIHSKGGKGRVVGTDGARMFIASFDLPAKADVPPWLAEGIILSRDALRSRISLLGKLSDDKSVRVSYAAGAASAELADGVGETTFKVKTLHGTFPDYEAALGARSFSDLDGEGNQSSREWQPVGINSAYLKQCGDIAKTLEAGLEKDQRSKLGMVIRAFNGGDAEAPLVLDFSTWPGAILVVSPAVMPTRMTSKETAAILAPALKATVAALRAHATRWDQRVLEASDEASKVEAQAKGDQFRKRVADILATVPAGPAIKADKPAPAPAPEPEAKPDVEAKPESASAEAEQQPEADPVRETKRPATKRTRVKVPAQTDNGAAAA